MKILSRLLSWLATILILGLPVQSMAGKLDLFAGFFNLEAETSTQKGSASALGAYKVAYATPMFTDSLELSLGYTLLMSNTVGGDLVYGVEAAAVYYPLTPSSSFVGQSDNAVLELNAIWRPLVGLSFNQRQAQSTNSGYAGFGVILGAERSLDLNFDLKMMFRYTFLSGPKSATANETTALIGVTVPFSIGAN